MAFSLPQAQDSPTYDAQALTDNTDLQAILAAGEGTGIVSGGATTVNSSGVNLKVDVAAGTASFNGAAPVAFGAVTALDPGAASTHDRRDIVVVNSSGTVSVVAGTPCSVAGWTVTSGVLGPVKPAIPASSALISAVYIPGTATSITASNLTDKRAAPSASYAPGTPDLTVTGTTISTVAPSILVFASQNFR